MAITEWRSPTANAIKEDRTPSITGIADAYSQNGTHAYCAGINKTVGTHPDVYLFSGFGFAVPTNAVITRVHIEVDGFYTETAATIAADSAQFRYVLRKSAAAGYSGSTFVEALNTTDDSTYQLLDNAATPLMGYSAITPAEANSSEFGVSVEFYVSGASSGTATINLDHIRLAIEYNLILSPSRSTSTGWLTNGGGATRSTSTGWFQFEDENGFAVTDVNLDESIFQGQTGVVITLDGAASATGKRVIIKQGANSVEQTVTAQTATSVTITVTYGGVLSAGAAQLYVLNPL